MIDNASLRADAPAKAIAPPADQDPKPQRSAQHAARQRARLRAVQWQKIIYLGIGWPLIVAGAIFTPLPTPIGLPMMLVGLFFVVRGSTVARRAIMSARSRWPELSGKLNAMKAKMPGPVRRFIQRTDPRLLKRKKKTPPPQASTPAA